MTGHAVEHVQRCSTSVACRSVVLVTEPRQTLANFLLDPARIAEVVSALKREGFDARPSPLNVPGVFARVREGTDDETRAAEVVDRTAGGKVSRGPGAAPTTHHVEYRDGL